MPKITSIQAQKNNPERVNIYLDGEFAFGISQEVLLKHGLTKGSELDEQKKQAVLEEEELGKELERAYRYLSYRPRSRFEMEQYFNKHDTPNDLVRMVLEKLEARDYIDDEAFAAWWVEERLDARPKGSLALRQELSQKGIDRKVIDKTLAYYQDRIESEEIVEEVVEKALKRYQKYQGRTLRWKLWQYLARRGYNSETIRQAVDKVLK